MATVAQCLLRAAELVGSDSARLDVEVILASVLQVDRAWLYTWPEKTLTPGQRLQFDKMIDRRIAGEPVAYITGEREFWSLPLAVNSSTLIPRPDTELLVELALSRDLPERCRVLDLGTGTGAIALALATEKPAWNITAADISVEAVDLAKLNVGRLALNNVQVLQSDWFGALSAQLFDLIVSNPPYIPVDDEHLQQGDVRFEPASALISGRGGYADLEKIVKASGQHLNQGGWLLLEHGFSQGEQVARMMLESGFDAVSVEKDLSGNGRVSLGRKS